MIDGMISSATALKSAQFKSQLSYALAAKQLDTQRQHGQLAVQLLAPAKEMAAQATPRAIGGKLDVTG